MKVKELIAKLKKMPQNLPVYWADHDQGEFEINASPRFVSLVDIDKLNNDDISEFNYQRKDYPSMEEKYVTIRP